MSEKAAAPESKPEAADAPAAPVVRRSPGHRGQDVRDTVAEMAARAHEISLEAGSKMAAAMKDVINAAAGLTGFAIESARDLVQYMVRRGQMTQEEADKLIREAEEAHGKRPGAVTAKPSYVAPDHAAAKAQRAAEKAAAAAAAAAAVPPAPAKSIVAASAPTPAPAAVAKAPAAKAPAAKAPAAKKAAAAPKKPAPAKGAVKRPAVAKASAKPAKKKKQ
jgi:polyhydroxyalkanoate synthesis regulator phasin